MLPNLSRLSVVAFEADADNDDTEEEDALGKILSEMQKRRAAGRRPVPAPSPQASPRPCLEGFRPKKRVARLRLPQWRTENIFDFSFENPLDGKFKDLPVVKALLADFPFLVSQRGTSYCHHEFGYRKRTVFVTSLFNFQPASPCPGTPCPHMRGSGSHPLGVADCDNAQKNSLPPKLIDILLESWKERPRAADTLPVKHWLLIDVFHGFGSIKKRVRENPAHADVKVFSNDIVNRSDLDATLDMRTFALDTLLAMALLKFWPEDARSISSHLSGAAGYCAQERVAVLFHLSTPCDTYSTQALGTHREKGTTEPKTKAAEDADKMNAKLIGWLRANALSERREL